MYEYLKKRHIDSFGLGADRYVPARPNSSVPWPIAYTTVQNIEMKCYHNAPREQVITGMVPYVMEISAPGNNFICNGNPSQECPESVHQNADPKDPWRQRQCAAWKQGWEREAAEIISSQGFRDQVTQNVLTLAGISGWRRWFAKSAEFIQVLDERERRERAIKIMAMVAFAAGGGAILWTYLAKKRPLEKNAHDRGGDWKSRKLRGSYYHRKAGIAQSRIAGECHTGPIRWPKIGTGQPPPVYAPWPVKEIYAKVAQSAAKNGIAPSSVRWVHVNSQTWFVGNINVGGDFWYFSVRKIGERLSRGATKIKLEILYKKPGVITKLAQEVAAGRSYEIDTRMAYKMADLYYREL